MLAATLTVLLASAGAAHGATWKRVTALDGNTTEQIALVRSNGDLYMAWRHRSGPNTEDLLVTRINANGTVGATVPVQSGWASLHNPAIVKTTAGFHVIFGGIRTTDPSETNDEISVATSTDGAAWTLTPGNIVPGGTLAYGSPVTATVLSDQTVLEGWAGSLGTWAHSGFSEASPNHDFQAPLGTYGYDPGLASSGMTAMMAWYSNAAGHLGVHAQGVAADGQPSGSVQGMPGTSNMTVGMLGRTPIVARIGGGFYVAYATGYPSLNRVKVWKVGSSSTTEIAKTTGINTSVTLGAAPDGRLWVAWINRVGFLYHVFARRSNTAGTAWGAVVDAGRPAVSGMYHLDGNATASALDVFVNATPNLSSNATTFYGRVFPGLSLTASRAKLPKGKTVSVTFAVRDAGVAVKGAKVKAGGKSGTTNAQGKVTLRLTGAGKSVKASASKSKYTGASLGLKVR